MDAKKRKEFANFKSQTLGKEDLSKKGSIDEPIRPLVEIINKYPDYCTTSTCSGRVTLIEKLPGGAGLKQGSEFLINSHECIETAKLVELVESYPTTIGNDNWLWLKFEPFIIHIQCIDVDKATDLLNVALATGNRNSGMTASRGGKMMVAVRSTSGLEAPVYCSSNITVSREYLSALGDECNRRMTDNQTKLAKFETEVDRCLATQKS